MGDDVIGGGFSGWITAAAGSGWPYPIPSIDGAAPPPDPEGGDRKDIAVLARLAAENGVTSVVLGLPSSSTETRGPRRCGRGPSANVYRRRPPCGDNVGRAADIGAVRTAPSSRPACGGRTGRDPDSLSAMFCSRAAWTRGDGMSPRTTVPRASAGGSPSRLAAALLSAFLLFDSHPSGTGRLTSRRGARSRGGRDLREGGFSPHPLAFRAPRDCLRSGGDFTTESTPSESPRPSEAWRSWSAGRHQDTRSAPRGEPLRRPRIDRRENTCQGGGVLATAPRPPFSGDWDPRESAEGYLSPQLHLRETHHAEEILSHGAAIPEESSPDAEKRAKEAAFPCTRS